MIVLAGRSKIRGNWENYRVKLTQESALTIRRPHIAKHARAATEDTSCRFAYFIRTRTRF